MTAIRLGNDGFGCGLPPVAGGVSRTSGRGLTTSRDRFGNTVIGIAIFPASGENTGCKKSFQGRTQANNGDGLEFVSFLSIHEKGCINWSKLTSLYPSAGSLCCYESQKRPSSLRSLPHLRRQTWRIV